MIEIKAVNEGMRFLFDDKEFFLYNLQEIYVLQKLLNEYKIKKCNDLEAKYLTSVLDTIEYERKKIIDKEQLNFLRQEYENTWRVALNVVPSF